MLALDKLFDDVAARFRRSARRVYSNSESWGTRRGDGAEMALIELIGSETKPARKEEKPEEKKSIRRFFKRGKKNAELESKASSEKKGAKAAGESESTRSGSKGKKRESGSAGTKPRTRSKKKEEAD